MYIHFIYRDGSNSNPYISMTNENLFKMICKYYLAQIEENTFIITEKREWIGAKRYSEKRDVLRAFAQDWQNAVSSLNYDLIGWTTFFYEYGKKYGLLREFRENGII